MNDLGSGLQDLSWVSPPPPLAQLHQAAGRAHRAHRRRLAGTALGVATGVTGGVLVALGLTGGSPAADGPDQRLVGTPRPDASAVPSTVTAPDNRELCASSGYAVRSEVPVSPSSLPPGMRLIWTSPALGAPAVVGSRRVLAHPASYFAGRPYSVERALRAPSCRPVPTRAWVGVDQGTVREVVSVSGPDALGAAAGLVPEADTVVWQLASRSVTATPTEHGYFLSWKEAGASWSGRVEGMGESRAREVVSALRAEPTGAALDDPDLPAVPPLDTDRSSRWQVVGTGPEPTDLSVHSPGADPLSLAEPGARIVDVGGEPGLQRTDGTVAWRPAPGVMAVLRGPSAPEVLLDAARTAQLVPADDPRVSSLLD